MNAIVIEPCHPLAQLFRPSIATPAIEALADAINSALDVGYRGLSVYGFARFGKTEGISYLVSHPKWIEPRRAAMLRIDAPEASKRSDSGFYRSTLTLLGVRRPARAEPEDLCLLITGRLIELCQAASSKLIVIFVDEAQRLLPRDYGHLVSLDNAMTAAGYYLFVVFIHQRDITGFANEVFSSTDYPPHVSGRFMVRKHEFKGLDGVADVAYACNRYDEGTEWPPGSGVSYTAHFAPTAFSNGFRLSQFAQQLWDAASNLRAAARLPAEWTWPMKSFEATVVFLLVHVCVRTPQFEGFTPEQIHEALYAAGVIELELSRHTYRPQGVK